ncbi:MAG: RagB/SusD family nutrient uptake outer membrane protein [Gemmatimonas sp.]|nr:RagB/SusD family nutrient uptake outer membrane protein [Gemmatimonas sp.]
MNRTARKASETMMTINGSDQQVPSVRALRRVRRQAILGLALSTSIAAGCENLDSLLAVDLPDQVVDEDLDDPALAETLVLSAQGDFECAFQAYQMVTGSWAGEIQYIHTGQYIGLIRYNTRSPLAIEYAGPCKGTGSDWRPSWTPLQLSRAEAIDAYERIQSFPEGSVTEPEYLMAKAKAYEGYSTLLLSEAFCGIVFDGDGVIQDRSVGFEAASNAFSDAIELAAQASEADATEIASLARVGRARARLNLGDVPGVLEDIDNVPEGFVYYATYDITPDRRQSQVEQLNGEWYTVHPTFRTLEVEGVPDPRVPTEQMDRLTQTGVEWWEQRKYADSGTDIPFASWREAQLMRAEVEGGQTAVDVINQLRATYDLPEFHSTDEQAIMDMLYEERRRELFQQGTKMGDDLRTGRYTEWDTGITPLGRPFGDETCIPVPDIELL